MADDVELLAPIITADYGKRLLADGRTAPKLMVRYRCPKCGGEQILDAYKGIPGHVICLDSLGRWTIMDPISVVHPTRMNRVEQDERSVEPKGWKAQPEVPAVDDEEFFRGARFYDAEEIAEMDRHGEEEMRRRAVEEGTEWT